MSLDDAVSKPHDRLAEALADDLTAVNHLIRQRMASEHAPRIPEVTAHLVEAGGKRLRPMLTLATARMCGYAGPITSIWRPLWNSSIPRLCCMTMWWTTAHNAAAGPPRICFGTINQVFWLAIICFHAPFN